MVPEPVIIGQDEETELRVQAVERSGRRFVEVRLWRNGPNGFAPSHTALIMEEADLDALREGIGELLKTSHGAMQPGRVVWDTDEGRRLRAEVEPIGTRYLAKLGFWQRVRDTWKPDGDGLTLSGDRLRTLREVLDRFPAWLRVEATEELPELRVTPQSEAPGRWPTPGADWLTIETGRVAFHPRGVRITLTVTQQGEHHRLALQQWKRQDSLWLPEPATLPLDISDLDGLLSHLKSQVGAVEASEVEIGCADGGTLHVRITGGDGGPMLRIEERREDLNPNLQPRLSLPAMYLPHFGRALAQGWSLLMGRLSRAELAELQTAEEQKEPVPPPMEAPGPSQAPVEAPDPSPAPVTDPEPSGPEVEMAAGGDRAEPPVEVVEANGDLTPTGRTFAFGAESETPGAVTLETDSVRIAIDGVVPPRSITVPIDVLPRIVASLEELDSLRRRQGRVDPTLLTDRPSCTMYGRVGTLARPEAVELRVWTSHAASDSISFEVTYLPELLEGLRSCVHLTGQTLWSTPVALPAGSRWAAREPASAIPAPAAAPSPTASGAAPHQPPAAARSEPVHTGPPPAFDSAAEPPPPTETPLGEVHLSRQHVSLTLQEDTDNPILRLHWQDQTLDVPVKALEELLVNVRALYYDALRGVRGRSATVGEPPSVAVSVHNVGTELHVALQHYVDGEVTRLTFPASDVPSFLNAAQAALNQG